MEGPRECENAGLTRFLLLANELNFKPNVAATGGYILTPWPTALGSWAINSGTSFSAPLVAGVGALYLQARGKGPISNLLAGLAFKTQIEQTAAALTTDLNDSGSITSLALQGAGLMNAYNAVNYKTFITPSLLELKDMANGDLKQKIVITNWSFSLQTYTITHIPALTAQTFSGGLPSMAPVMSSAAASVKFSSTKITVWPLIPAVLTVTFTPPSGLDASTFPVYSGQIQISNGKETVVSSYSGLAANLKDVPIIDTSKFCESGLECMCLLRVRWTDETLSVQISEPLRCRSSWVAMVSSKESTARGRTLSMGRITRCSTIVSSLVRLWFRSTWSTQTPTSLEHVTSVILSTSRMLPLRRNGTYYLALTARKCPLSR